MTRENFYNQEHEQKPIYESFHINLWCSHPDEDNDDCMTGDSYDTLEEARKIFDAIDPIAEMARTAWDENLFIQYYASTPFIELDGPDVNEVRQLREPKKQKDDDTWRHEYAMQQGMAFGCDGYNEAMGYDTENDVQD